MGSFIRNKSKRMQKVENKQPMLINTNINNNNISEEKTVIKKRGIKNATNHKNISTNIVEKKPETIDTQIQKTQKSSIKIVESDKKQEPIYKLFVNKKINQGESKSIFDSKNDNTPMINKINGSPKNTNRKDNFSVKSDNNIYNFIFGNDLLSYREITVINTKLDTLLDSENINLSFINLYFFKTFIKDKKIALIANSTDLLNKKLGDVIDSHDIVIRFNSYKISKEHTGEKTTMHASVYLQNENLNQYVPIRFILSNHPKNWSKKLKTIDKLKQGALLKYNHHTIIPQGFTEPYPSTTGFSTLILLLKLGGYEKINMFGFNFYEGGDSSIYRTEGGMQLPISKVHDYNFEKNFVMEYSYEFNKKDNIITFYDHSTF